MADMWTESLGPGFLPLFPPLLYSGFGLSEFESLCNDLPKIFGGDAHAQPSCSSSSSSSTSASASASSIKQPTPNNEEVGAEAFLKRVNALPVIELHFSEDEAWSSCNAPPGPRSAPSMVVLESSAVQERAFNVFAFLTNATVRAYELRRQLKHQSVDKSSDPIILPRCIAVPMVLLANQVGRQPILDYATCVLSNYRLKDPSLPVSFDNVAILNTFTGLLSEEWFYTTHVVIEMHGANVMAAMRDVAVAMGKAKANDNTNGGISNSSAAGISSNNTGRSSSPSNSVMGNTEVQSISNGLHRMGKAITDMNAAMKRMPDHCRDNEFFDTIRPWLASWPPCGVVYDGVSPDRINLSGASGAQSSLLPCIDAFLGVPNLSAAGGHGHCQMGGAAVVSPATAAFGIGCPHAGAGAGGGGTCAGGATAGGAGDAGDAAAVAITSRDVERKEASKAFHVMLLGYRRHMPPAHRDLIAVLEEEFVLASNGVKPVSLTEGGGEVVLNKCPFPGHTMPQEAGEVWETTQLGASASADKILSHRMGDGLMLNIRDLLSNMETRLQVLVTQEQRERRHTQGTTSSSAESSEERVVSKMKYLAVEPVALADRERMHIAHSTNSVVRIKTVYNECIEGLVAFRRYHVGLATLYISRMAAKHRRREREVEANAAKASNGSMSGSGSNVAVVGGMKLKMHKGGDKGTGGSSFSTHLMKHITNTRQCLYDTSVSRELAGVRGREDTEYALPGLGRRLPHDTVFGRR